MTTQQILRGVVAGCDVAPQASPNRTVIAGTGWVLYDNQLIFVAGNSTLSVPDPTPGTVSFIGIDSTGTWVVLNGTDPAAQSLIVPCYQAVETDGVSGIGAAGGPVLQDIRNLLLPPHPSNALAFTFLNTALTNVDPGAGNFGFDTTDITTIAHAYLNYQSPSWASVTGAYLSLITWLGQAALTSGYAPILKCWSAKEPNKIVRLKVTGITNNNVSGAPVWATLDCTVLEATANDLGAVTLTPKLSTDAFDTMIEIEGYVPSAVQTWTVLKKLGNTARASTVALAADPDLQFAMAANTTYIIRGFLRFDANTITPGFKYDFDGPASPTRVAIAIFDCAAGGTPAGIAMESAYNTAHSRATAASFAPGMVRFELIVENGANAGTFSLRWAQSTSNGTATNVREGSYMEYAVS